MSENSIAAEACIIVNPLLDNVAVSKVNLERGTKLVFEKKTVVLNHEIDRGQRFAVKKIKSGTSVIQYGYPFGISAGIEIGEIIKPENIKDIKLAQYEEVWCSPPETVYAEKFIKKTFDGYRRSNGLVGTRNYYLLVPASQCASATVVEIERAALGKYRLDSNFPNVDGIVAIPHTEGCGCASNIQIDRTLRVLQNFISHPNVGGVLVLDLGCEQTNYATLHSYLKNNKALPLVPIDWLTIQKEGGTQKTIRKALDIIGLRLPEVNAVSRTICPIEHLVVGTECGASDTFSGITANLVIGNVVDKVIKGKGSAILSEIPEMVGAEHILIKRMRHRESVTKFKEIMTWYRDIAMTLGVDMSDNLVPENIAGGLINACIKSIGAIIKGGTMVIEDILDYGERLLKRGLHIMQGPGNDIESVTGMVASGANIVCFSTGRGTVTGSAIVPVIKISSTTELYNRMPGDIDFDAGGLLDIHTPKILDKLGDDILDLLIAVASGEESKSEQNKQGQFQIWTAGKLPL